jgi:hypothetical protein
MFVIGLNKLVQHCKLFIFLAKHIYSRYIFWASLNRLDLHLLIRVLKRYLWTTNLSRNWGSLRRKPRKKLVRSCLYIA